jgi:hypothetical protein
MSIKSILVLALLTVGIAAVSAAPAPPTTTVSTNTPFADQTILTNVAVSMPVGNWNNATIYAPAKSLKDGIQLSWTPIAGAVGYQVYYGDVTKAVTNKFDVTYNSGAVFFGLSTNITYFFFSTAYDAARVESAPSNLVLFKPGT